MNENKIIPAASPDAANMFRIDCNINVGTIDEWLGRDDAVYRDVRMLMDPADYAAIGGDSRLSSTVEGFKVVPYPYLASLSFLPVKGAYRGETLFKLKWNKDGSIASAKANYAESMQILEDLFPKDKAIFIMCGGGGYAGMTRDLLVFLGWDADKVYNVGAGWAYQGAKVLDLVIKTESGEEMFATWKADYAVIDFSLLHAID